MRFSPFVAALFAAVFLAACGGTDSSTCGPSNCSGCCNAAGLCESGDLTTACGGTGVACSACAAGQTCSLKSCVGGGTGGGSGGGSGGGAGGGGGGSDAGTADAGAIVAPNDQWSWIDFPDSECGNGAPTGIGFNPTTRSSDILIYMQGGGACWNSFTCFTIGSATYIQSGYTATTWAGDTSKSAYAFSRSATGNPFKDMSYVFVPYCTGDVHGGDAVAQYDNNPPVHHKGKKNVEAYLRRLKLTFPNPTRVFVGGSSAGAFGSQINYELVKQTWPSSQIHVLADCGQMINPSGSLLADWIAAWNLEIPAGCSACSTDFTKVPDYLAKTYPQSRFALLAYTQDNTLRQFFGYSTGPLFETQTLNLLTASYDPNSNAKYYVLAGTSHVMLGGLNTITAPTGKTLNSWVTEFVNGSSGWASLKP